jgi:hypothetical protein
LARKELKTGITGKPSCVGALGKAVMKALHNFLARFYIRNQVCAA